MRPDRMEFQVTQLSAEVVAGVPVVWRNGAFPSGPLTIELDEGTGVHASNGVLDYSRKRAAAEFHVRLSFPELAQMLEDLRAERSWTQPVRAVHWGRTLCFLRAQPGPLYCRGIEALLRAPGREPGSGRIFAMERMFPGYSHPTRSGSLSLCRRRWAAGHTTCT
jgi:hypothetical protein